MFLNSIFKNISDCLVSAPRPATDSRRTTIRGQGATTMTATLRNLEGQDDATILREIQSALNGLKFGSVEITVHNGQVVQIERKEKFRLQQPGSKNA